MACFLLLKEVEKKFYCGLKEGKATGRRKASQEIQQRRLR